ncbi:MAG: pyridoxal 5'-phosphate synthase glutaminase subunit PdxT [Dehalococcoidia bacterium]
MKIGVLALQGAFREHISALQRLKAEAPPIRLPQDLEGLDGLIIPGGESTSIGQLMESYRVMEPIRGLASGGFPVMGTCAGLILLGKKARGLSFDPLGVMDIEVRRNAFGRQVDSFESSLPIPVLGETPFPGVFIRAPMIEEVGEGVQILARLPEGPVVAARQGRLLVSAFHPELTRDLRFHAYFLNSMIAS